MKQLITSLLFLALSMSALAQPAQTLKLTQLEMSPDSSLREGYVGVTDTNGRQRYQNYVEVNVTCLTYTPPALNNIPFYRSKFVTKCSTDSTWYIDWEGRSIFISDNGPISLDICGLQLDADTLCLMCTWGGSCVILPAGGSGTVTSVALSAPASIFDISGSPITSSGTLALALDNQAANTVFAGPTSGGAAAPTFRGLVGADMPLNVLDSTHIKAKGIAFTSLAPTAGISINQAPLWNPTLSKFVAKTVLTTEAMGSNNLSGLLTNPTVVAIQDVSVASTTPTNAQVFQYNSGATEWQPTTLSVTNAQLAANSVDSTKVANGALSMDDLGQRGAGSGQAIAWNGSAWRPTSIAPSGAAGGNLTGTYPNPTIANNAVDSTKVANGTLALDDLNQRGASTGQAIAWNGSAWRPTTFPGATTTHEYTTAQTNTSLAVPTAAKTALITVVGAGGGGGSGRKGAAGSVRCGGGGGASGGVVHVAYPLDGSISTLYINVGTGGGGGASRTANSSSGLGGSAGGDSDVRSTTSASDIIVLAGGGDGGSGGTASGGSGGGAATDSDGAVSAGGSANAAGGSANAVAASTSRCGGGGGGGGGINTSNVAGTGGTGGSGYLGLQAGGAPPSAISLKRESGGGGDGGAASTLGNATGGSGGVRGGGGGGGGASLDGVGNSGAGGAGGVGYVKVIFVF
jgi:hypothetical protein